MSDEEKSAEYKAAYAAGFETGRTQTRERYRAIAKHPEAEGREALALHIAANTDMSPDEAVKVLALSARVAK